MGPFIPIFYMGEEFNNSVKTEGNMYMNRLDLSLLDDPEHRAYFEEFKSLIRIRRLYPEIFTEFPNRLRDTKIEEVEVVGLETIQGYVRYNDEIAIMVIGNNNLHTNPPFTVRVPFQAIGYPDAEYQITDLLTNQVIAKGNYATLYDFKANVAKDKAGIYMLSKVGDIIASERHNFRTYADLSAALAAVKPAVNQSSSHVISDASTTGTHSTHTVKKADTTPEKTIDTANTAETEEIIEKVPVKKRVRRAVEVDVFPTWLIAVIAAAVLLIGGGAFLLVFFKRRKKQKTA